MTPLTKTSPPVLECVHFTTAHHLPLGKLRARHCKDAGCWARFANINLQPGAWRTLILSPLLCHHRSTLPMPSCPVPLPVVRHIAHRDASTPCRSPQQARLTICGLPPEVLHRAIKFSNLQTWTMMMMRLSLSSCAVCPSTPQGQCHCSCLAEAPPRQSQTLARRFSITTQQ